MTDGFRHFAIERLADGVWAAIHRTEPPAPDAWAISNAGIVDLGDRTLVFDALMTDAAAEELRAAAEELTGRAPELLVLSHAHNDHAWGAARFADATVVSSAAARATLASDGREEIDDYRAAVADRLATWSAAADGEDPVARDDAAFFLPYWTGVAATLPGLALRLPDVTVEGRLWIEGSGRSVELRTSRPAHTDGDLVLVVPDARVAFCGDLLFVGCHPYLADGDLDGLRAALGEIERLGAERLVPGHGPVGGAAEAATLTAYLDDIESIARRAPDQEPGVAIPDAYRAWGLRRFFAANVAFVSGPASDQRS